MMTIHWLSLTVLGLWLPYTAIVMADSHQLADRLIDNRAAQLVVCMTSYEPLFGDPLGGKTQEPIRACNALLDSGYDANGDIYYFLGRLIYYRAFTDQAVELFEQARAAGSVKGTTALAAFYELPLGRAANSLGYEDAVARAGALYEEAAMAGDPVAKVALAGLFVTNQWVEPGEEKILAWLQSAADDGYPVADYFLGMHYRFLETGDPDTNRTTAIEYYERAARGGVAAAFDDLEILGHPMTPPASGTFRYPSMVSLDLALSRHVPLEDVGSPQLSEAI